MVRKHIVKVIVFFPKEAVFILRLKDEEGQKRMTQGGASEVWWGLATCLRQSMQAGWVEMP